MAVARCAARRRTSRRLTGWKTSRRETSTPKGELARARNSESGGFAAICIRSVNFNAQINAIVIFTLSENGIVVSTFVVSDFSIARES